MSFLSELKPQILQGYKPALTRAMTFIENEPFDLFDFFRLFQKHTGKALRLALTGPPGVGKSTLVAFLIEALRKEGKTVGVVAVDPSSVIHSGALLGDRIRMQHLALDEGVYIRSMASRGLLGGIAQRTFEMVDLMDASGKDYILIETVGIGQQELDVYEGVDLALLILSPEAGDSVQAMKSGIIEVCHVIGVNKADRPGIDLFLKDLEDILALRTQYVSPDHPQGVLPPILKLSGKTGEGLNHFYQVIQSFLLDAAWIASHREKQRTRFIQKRIRTFLHHVLTDTLHNNLTFRQRLEELSSKILHDQLPPEVTSTSLIKEFFEQLV